MGTSTDTRPGNGVALRFDHVTKRYGQTAAVSDLSFTVEPGRVTGYLGPNGAGKSTTMKILVDLAAADRGTATIGGKRYRDLADPLRTMGVILEPSAFHPARTGRSHLRVLADGAGLDHRGIGQLLATVGLTDAADRKVGGYSMGMKQRLGLASALLGDPQVLVLDEPANGLDPQGIRWLRDLLRSHATSGKTVFVSSHLMGEMELLADEVVVINRGRLVTTGSVSSLREVGTLVRTPADGQLTTVVEQAGGAVTRRPDGALTVTGLSAAEIGDRAAAAGIALHELSPQSKSLEELFLGLTGGDEPVSPDERAGQEVSA